MSFLSKLVARFLAATPSVASLPSVPVNESCGLSWRLLLTEIGLSTPTCPYCRHVFQKMLMRKRPCPKCNGIIYSRKRAVDGTRVLLTQADLYEGEAQYALVTLVRQGVSDAELDGLVGKLLDLLGRPPSADDVVGEYFARAAQKHSEALDWGLYRNARFLLADYKARSGEQEDALRLLLEVSIIDLNGPRNYGRTTEPTILEHFPAFDPRDAFLAPGIISMTIELIEVLQLSPHETQQLFESVAGSVASKLNLPRSATSAWNELAVALIDAQG